MPIANLFLWAVIALVALLGYESFNEYRVNVQRYNSQLQRRSPGRPATPAAVSGQSSRSAVYGDQCGKRNTNDKRNTGTRFFDIGIESTQPEMKAVEYSLPSRPAQMERMNQAMERVDCA